MIESRGIQLAQAKKVGTENDHPAFDQIDAPELFVSDSFAAGCMTIDRESDWDLAGNVFRLIKQRRHPKPRQSFIAERADAIARPSWNSIHPFHFGLGVAPFGRFSTENDLIENRPANVAGLGLPFCHGMNGGHPWHTFLDERRRLPDRLPWLENAGIQEALHVPRFSSGKSDATKGEECE